MAEVNWESFWESYRNRPIASESDLYFEVGKTVQQKPLSPAAFSLVINNISDGLELVTKDRLLDLCCGNGLITRQLAPCVKDIVAVDFSRRLIENARRFSNAPNVTYHCGEVVAYVNELVRTREYIPSKILMASAVAYFEMDGLMKLLERSVALTRNNFLFLATDIPSDPLKMNFYNTPERVRRYEANQSLAENYNDGIGRWWRDHELEDVAQALGLRVVIKPQPQLSNFRVDALFQPNEYSSR